MPTLITAALALTLATPTRIPLGVSTLDLSPKAIRAAVQSAPSSGQERTRQAEARQHRGTMLALVGGSVTLAAFSASVVCHTDASGECDPSSRRLVSGLRGVAVGGAIVAVIGLVMRARASADLEALGTTAVK